ncbi:MAG TPA: GIY-YIG nuclease family protein [Patescibacteria group bacterium]
MKRSKKVKYYFYILKCKDGSLYSGIARNPANREHLHNVGKGSIYVRTHGGGKIIYQEELSTQSQALKREIEVKKWPRARKLKLLK